MADTDTYVGVFMRELPPDWWLPDGYTLTPHGSTAPLMATDPAGHPRFIYPVPGFRPPPERERSIAQTITRELGPPPKLGFSPETRQVLGMERPDLLGTVDRAFYAPLELGAYVLDLANYGIQASVVAGVEGAGRAGWIADTAGWRKELLGFLEFLGIEAGRSPVTAMARGAEAAAAAKVQASELGEAARVGLARAEAARAGLALRAQAVAQGFSPMIVRMETVAGLPEGRSFAVLDVVEADTAFPSSATSGTAFPGATVLRSLTTWLERVRAGKEFDRQQAARYRFNQIYVEKISGKGYWVLDSYEPRDPALGAGPVSRKFTQLADIKEDSAFAMLTEAKRKYSPGTRIADVRSRPDRLVETYLSGQLWLEVPIQTSPVPASILRKAKELSIKIRDINGTIYE
ncbi:hypothetical protein [Nitrospirillum pindoramense]|uniref:Uncharacterized protein n=1 Tax=Nitrospirillum amazonense TaxID=28077 RepID=A0A560GH34_9PROT|nr:hypothetical protein [Nitrospirillum amazonense]TWB33267.1 hypothetical protein FBZ90_1359 [Nitrospirillum amazonense]